MKNLLKHLHPVMYNYNDKVPGLDTSKKTIGVLAQDIIKGITESGFNPDDFSIIKMNDNGFYSVDYIQLIPILISTIKDLETRLEKLENNSIPSTIL